MKRYYCTVTLAIIVGLLLCHVHGMTCMLSHVVHSSIGDPCKNNVTASLCDTCVAVINVSSTGCGLLHLVMVVCKQI